MCHVPVHSQTEPCTSDILPPFHSEGEENGRLCVNEPDKHSQQFTKNPSTA